MFLTGQNVTSHEIKTSHDILPSYAELWSVTENKFHWGVINCRRKPGQGKGEVSCGEREMVKGGNRRKERGKEEGMERGKGVDRLEIILSPMEPKLGEWKFVECVSALHMH